MTAPQTQSAKPKAELQVYLVARLADIAGITGSEISAKRLIAGVQLAAARDPRILECTHNSVLESMLRAARLGLDISGTGGQAYLAPFFNKERRVFVCTLMLGYPGLVSLARRDGRVVSIEARVVYKGDRFEARYGTEPAIDHWPDFLQPRRDEDVLFAYAVGTYAGGTKRFVVLTRAHLDDARQRSGDPDGCWKWTYPAMAEKTAVRRWCKLEPLPPEAAECLDQEDGVYPAPPTAAGSPVSAPGPEAAPEPPPSRTAALAAKVAGRAGGGAAHPAGALPSVSMNGLPAGDFYEVQSVGVGGNGTHPPTAAAGGTPRRSNGRR